LVVVQPSSALAAALFDRRLRSQAAVELSATATMTTFPSSAMVSLWDTDRGCGEITLDESHLPAFFS
jgi:hypothetical protein